MSNRSKEAPKPVSSHTSDPVLAPFIAPTFDPTAYLNSTLPPLGIATTQQPIISSKLKSLPDLVSQTQTQLAQLSAQESRLVDTLTSLTDEILRSGSRLAYEVELLRGEAVGLEEVMGTELAGDVSRFVAPKKAVPERNGGHEDEKHVNGNGDGKLPLEEDDDDEDGDADLSSKEPAAVATETETSKPDVEEPIDPLAPPALARLRTLHRVRTSLQSVISTFDAALSFPLPPSLLTQTTSATSFVSVAAPVDHALEAAGQEALAKMRASIFDHLDAGKGGEGGAEGVAAAEKRLEELRDLCTVWKGTSEEKARVKVIEGWEKELQEAKERLGANMRAGRRSTERSRADSLRGETVRENSRSRGIFGGLRRLGGME